MIILRFLQILLVLANTKNTGNLEKVANREKVANQENIHHCKPT
jgi:hypothetical protein